MPAIISANRNRVKLKVPKNRNNSYHGGSVPGNPRESPGSTYLFLAALRLRAAFDRIRAICPLGKVRHISPIHSSFTPLIGLALKLMRLTMLGDFPRSTVFR